MSERITAPYLEIQLLGDFRLTRAGRPLDGINTSRQQSLLVYPLLHRAAPQPRCHVAFLFWPDATEEPALHEHLGLPIS